MSLSKAPGNTVAGPDAPFTTRVGDLLFANTSLRPSPHLMATLINEGLDESQLLAAGEQRGRQQPVMKETLRDLDASLPYFHMLSDRLATDFPDTTLLFAGRDAEALYDDFSIAHGADHVNHLMPASTAIWLSTGMRNAEHAAEFLASYGLSGAQVTNRNNKYAVVDTGFRGSIGSHLRDTVDSVHGVSLSNTGQLAIRLVSAEPVFKDRQIMEFERIRDFPILTRIQRVTPATDRARIIAIEMQIMPRYHGAFINLANINGKIIATPADGNYEPMSVNIDRVGYVNSSVVNPLAAAITQYRVVKAAMNREPNSERVPGQDSKWSAARRLASFLLKRQLA